MSFAKKFADFLNAHMTPAPESGAPVPSAPEPGESTAPSVNRHVERKKIAFRQVGPDDTIPESEEQWQQNGGDMEGDTLTTRAITASGQLADPSKLQSVCSICNRLEDTIIRSEISHVILCRVCQRIFEKPDGGKMVVTPKEFEELSYKFDTWERHDAKRKGGGK